MADDTPTAVELRQTAQITKVLTLVAQGRTVTDACKEADVPRSTYYAIMKSGIFDELLAQMKQANIVEVMTRFSDALPLLMERVLKDALNEHDGDDDGLSARDRDQAARTALLMYEKIAGRVGEPATGESAKEWLEKHGDRFQPIQIVGSRVVIQQGQAAEVIEGEVEELEEES